MSGNGIGEQIRRDLDRYSDDVKNEIRKAMRNIQRDMVSDITATTPIRPYPWNNGVIRERLAGRIRVKAPDNEQPGAMKSSWVTATLKNTDTRYVIGVRNKARPHVVHLVNFGHDMYTHNYRIVGRVQGKPFVDEVQERAMQRLDTEITRILGG